MSIDWKLKTFILFTLLLLAFSIILYLRDYYEAVGQAERYRSEGRYELAEDMLNLAHGRIRGMLITFTIWAIVMVPIIYRYRKMKKK
jgi:hypothetical protein